MTDITQKSNEFLLAQLHSALVAYGRADAMGIGKQKNTAKGMINRLVRELRARGVDAGFIREIE